MFVTTLVILSIFAVPDLGKGSPRVDIPPPQPVAAFQPTTTAEAADDAAARIAEAVRLIVGDNTDDARRIGVRNLLRIGSPEALAELRRVLSDSSGTNSAARSAVCAAIAAAESPPSELMTPLVGLIGSGAGLTPDLIASALGAYPLAETQRELIRLAMNPNETVARRISIIEMIGRLGEDYSAAGALSRMMSEEDAGIRSAALVAMTTMTGVEFESETAAQEWWRERSGSGEAKWLAQSNKRRREEIRTLRAERQALVDRLVAAYRDAFLQLPEKDQPKRLVAFLSDEAADIRRLGLDLVAAKVVDQKEVSSEVRDALMLLLSDRLPDIRRRAAISAGNLRIAGAADRIIAMLDTEARPRVRAALAGALGRLDDNRAVPPLVKCLTDSSRDVVAEAIVALGMLGRAGHADAEINRVVTKALTDHLNGLSDDDELRERCLLAMARVGSPSFREIFQREAAPGRSGPARAAATAGLGSYDNGQGAEFLLTLLSDEDAAVRAAAAQALGRCGRTVPQLESLFMRMSEQAEADGLVREKAWEAAQVVFGRLSGDTRLNVIRSMAEDTDPGAPRRCAVLARSLKLDTDALAPLPVERRLELVMILADALLRSGDAAASVAEWTALSAVTSEQLPGDAQLRIDRGLVCSAIRAGQDAAALERFRSVIAANSDIERFNAIIECIGSELEARLTAAQTADAIATVSAIETQVREALGERAAAERARLDGWQTAIRGRTVEVIDVMLDDKTGGPAVAKELEKFDRELVLEQLHAELTALPTTTTGPAGDREAALIALARHLAPKWTGYEPGCPPDERAKALASLRSS